MVGIDHDCCRMERYKYAFYRRFKEPRLYRLASKGEFGPIPQRCQTHPKEAEFVHQYAPSDTALHQILRFPPLEVSVDCKTRECLEQVKTDAISSLIDTYRPIASITDSFWRTPLHLACMNLQNCTEEAFCRILQAWPKAAAHQDMEGRAPLHYLVARNNNISLPVLKAVLKACPAAATMKDICKQTPLDIVESRSQEELQNRDEVAMLLKTQPGASVDEAATSITLTDGVTT